MITQMFEDLVIKREQPDIASAICLYQIAITLEDIREILERSSPEIKSPFDECPYAE